MKAAVLDFIGETGLGTGAAVNAALRANDRVKYLLSLLQAAISHADKPDLPLLSLKRERLGCDIDDEALDQLPQTARREGERYRIPGVSRVLSMVSAEMRVMAAPVLGRQSGEALAARLKARLAEIPQPSGDVVDGVSISALSKAERNGADSLHLLVMDLHRALNTMQAELAQEVIDGASAYEIEPEDKPRIAAFMAGVSRTAPLKFDHPGLGTTATRSGGKLVIQNDIGTTDAHVIVIRVAKLAAEVVYTDVHAERARFLRDTLAKFSVSWSGEQTAQAKDLAEGAPFTMITGRFTASNEDELREYLRFLGSRLVFLIDWNRARKQLRGFVKGPQRYALLRWAAEAEVGHRGFLQLGGAQLVNEAIEGTAHSAMHFGDRLCDVLGDEKTMSFLQFVLRTAADGLRARHPRVLIRDRIQAELQSLFGDERRRLLEVALGHAELIFEIASLVRDGVRNGGADGLARRARDYEHDADELVLAMRQSVQRRPDEIALLRLLEAADDAADELEDAAFLLELLESRSKPGAPRESLGTLADLLVEAAQEWVKAVASAEDLPYPQSQEDIDDFLSAVDRLLLLEHQADDAERDLIYTAVEHANDFRELHLYTQLGHALEEAADAFKRTSLHFRNHILGTSL